jgi:hypothetical protein
MTKIKYIFSNITILNVLLTAVIVTMAFFFLFPQLRVDMNYVVPTQKVARDVKDALPAPHSVHSLSDYVVVAEENLFHLERKVPPEKASEEKPLPKPDFILYGTVIADDVKIAFIEDLKAPRTTTGRGKRQNAVRQGDVLSGFTVREVGSDRISMVRGEEKITVHVQRDRSKTESAVAAAAATPGQPVTPEAQISGSGRPVSRVPATRTRAPMTPAEERVRGFFTR